MALVKCSECGHTISTLAETCPQCGAPGPQAIQRANPTSAQAPQPVPSKAPTQQSGKAVLSPGKLPGATSAAGKRKPGRPFVTVLLYLIIVILALFIVLLAGQVIHVSSPNSAPGKGYLWYTSYPDDQVGVIGEAHQQAPTDMSQAWQWEARREACLAEPGAQGVADNVKHPFLTSVAVKVVSGRCAGFHGWVPLAAWHNAPP